MASRFFNILRAITHRRSAGIPVPRAIARAIRAGDRARGAGDWAAARGHYLHALARARQLAHVWLQAGHAAKESGDLSGAAAAYRHAAGARPDDPEPHIHLGHVAKLDGATAQAAGHYLDALRRAPDALAAASEFLRAVDGRSAAGRAMVAEAATLLGLPLTPSHRAAPGAAHGIVFDVSDLLSYFSHARLPTGIQRVQIEIVAAALAGDGPAQVCCFSEAARGWVALPADRFAALAALALASDDRADLGWRRAVIGAMLEVAAAPAIRFGARAVLVNLGASWAERNYFLHLRTARQAGGPFYVPLIHDVIPLRHPEWFPPALVRDFRAWTGAVAAHADGFLANSEATARDLARELGGRHAPVRALPLDGDFGGRGDPGAAARLGLGARPFVLMVSTIEPRKNHLGLFAAWSRLIARLGEDRVPMLACVGGRGWMNDAVHARLAADAALRRKVVLLHGVSDADLAGLYDACLFTVYPSLYEGWGLPITEALCHGKVPAVSNTTAMPEAGGAFAAYFDPADPDDMAAVLGTLIADPAARAARERRIADGFRPRSWRAIADALRAEVARLTGGAAAAPITPAPPVEDRLSLRADGDAAGEMLRVGVGWGPPGSAGTEILGIATLRVPPARPVALRLTARDGAARPVRVSAGGRPLGDILLAGGTSGWLHLADTGGGGTIEIAAEDVLLAEVAFGIS